MRTTSRLLVAPILATLVALEPPARAAHQESQPAQSDASARATRADLAAAYLRIDRAIANYPPAGERLAEVNREFDAASLLFFANRFDEAVRRIDALTATLLTDSPETASRAKVATVVESSMEAVREANAIRLQAVESAGAARRQAIESCKARNRLLSDRPSSSNSAQFLVDPVTLAQQVASEIAALERGEDPYAQRDGDVWRLIIRNRDEVPVRIYAPPLRSRDTSFPLVIALHGAGGDENMFPEAYGAGVIKKLADEHGFILASPLTYPLAGDATLLDALIDEMATCYDIDRDRIYLIGHSLGAGAALGLAQMRPNAVVATCAIAGGGVPRSRKIPPTLVIAAELDALAGPGAAERGAQAAATAQANGVPVEFRVKKNWGHTLVVGAALPEAIDWLLKHDRAVPPASTSTQPDAVHTP